MIIAEIDVNIATITCYPHMDFAQIASDRRTGIEQINRPIDASLLGTVPFSSA